MSKRWLPWLLAATALELIVRWKWLDIPFFRDEGLYAYMGQRWLQGVPPFVSVNHQMGPLLSLFNAIGLLISGPDSEAGIHFVAAVCSILGLFFTMTFVRERDGDKAALGSACIWLLIELTPHTQALMASSELFSVPLLALGMWMASSGRPVPAGLAVCAAGLVRQTALLLGLPILLLACRRSPRAFLQGSLAIALPFLLVPLLYWGAGYGQLWYQSNVPSLFFYRLSAEGGFTGFAAQSLAAMPVVFLLVALECVLAIRSRSWLPLALVVFCALGVWSPHRYFGRNWLPCLPVFAWLGGRALARVRPVFWTPLLLNAAWILSYWTLSPEDYCVRYYGPEHLQARTLGRAIRRASRPGDTVYNWGNEWGLYYYSGSVAPTRHLLQNTVVYAAYVTLFVNGRYSDVFWRWQKEVTEDLAAHLPTVFVVSAPFMDYSHPDRFFLPGVLQQILHDNYQISEGADSNMIVYRRKERP